MKSIQIIANIFGTEKTGHLLRQKMEHPQVVFAYVLILVYTMHQKYNLKIFMYND